MNTPPIPEGGLRLTPFLVWLPNDRTIRGVIHGASILASYNGVWTQSDNANLTVLDVTSIIKESVISMTALTGTLVASLTPVSGALPLDGSTHAKDDFPDLWAVLPSYLKDPTSFTLPNATGRFVMGMSEGLQGGTGGETQVSIGLANLPSHNHATSETVGTYSPLGNIDVAIPVPVVSAIVEVPTVTGSSGGSTPLDLPNPPYVGVLWYVWT